MKGTEGKRYFLGAIVLVAGAALMAFGIRNGEMVVVMQKAVQICMECIGIG